MNILNLGCGTKISANPEVVNVDWSVYLLLRKYRILHLLASPFLRGARRERYKSLAGNIKVHNHIKGIPYPENSIDVVYHSHFFEHFDQGMAKRFQMEVRKVLKQGGIQRIVIPNFESLVQAYIDHLSICKNKSDEWKVHDNYIAGILEQSVRKEAFGTSQQPPFRRFVENLILGDARRRGETHQWMYDQFNLAALLEEVGFKEFALLTYNTSNIPNWNTYGLDYDESGSEYHPGSLYAEVRK